LVGGTKQQKLKHGNYEELGNVLIGWLQQAYGLNYSIN
jgi:hypothetical protein